MLLMSLAWRFYINNHVTNSQNSSLTWKSIKIGWSLCRRGLSHVVGNGASTLFWQDKWCTPFPLCHSVIGPFPANELKKKVSSYYKDGYWDFSFLPFVLPCQVMNIILSYSFPNCPREDKVIWPYTSNGRFNTSSASTFLQSTYPDSLQPNSPDLSWIWKHLHTLPKIKFFLWICSHNCMPTRLLLWKRHIATSPL